jgi:DNA repair exonuclease SbcCD ATPase subunit
MIIFEKLRYKNFLSSGNQYTEIDFNTGSTNLIIGSNGAGKSTFLDALTFVLFGKSFRGINKPQLVNSTNEKDCVVEIEFKINTNKFKVIRGIKPAFFYIIKDNVTIDQVSSSIDQQKWFESTVLKMNYKSFTQIVILGSGNFIPFMQLTSSHRREVIEDLLDLKVFSLMNGIVKEKLRGTKDSLKLLSLRKDGTSEKIKIKEKYISDIQNETKESIRAKQSKISEIIYESETLTQENEQIEEKIKILNSQIEYLKRTRSNLKELESIKGKLSHKLDGIEYDLDFFETNTVCPTCTQGIDNSFRVNRIGELREKENVLKSGFNELLRKISKEEIKEEEFLKISKQITNLSHEISQNNTRISGNQKQINYLESEIQKITTIIEDKNTEYEQLDKLNKNLIDLLDQISSNNDLVNHYSFIFSLLKDSGVKTQIIKKYLPLINQQVNRYLQMMDFYINFSLDEEFNEKIQSPIHEDFTYTSFSQGERQRIDLSLLFAWREVAKIKNSVSTNLIIFDEIFDSSLDGFGMDDFLKIIKYIIKDANIFVISHKSGLEDKFDSVYKFEKVKGFSFMKKL